ncbi:hypothetical protein GJ496_004688 [Pomphorhynchus laevis]|nr:hypothetical protein GJ496_004688 [Pomphorhynchus laevis]
MSAFGESVKLLGYLIKDGVIKPYSMRYECLLKIPSRKIAEQKRSIGMFSHYSKFITSFSDKIHLLANNQSFRYDPIVEETQLIRQSSVCSCAIQTWQEKSSVFRQLAPSGEHEYEIEQIHDQTQESSNPENDQTLKSMLKLSSKYTWARNKNGTYHRQSMELNSDETLHPEDFSVRIHNDDANVTQENSDHQQSRTWRSRRKTAYLK